MKAEHRHELKTNELAEWLGHLPEWFKTNRTTIIGVGAVVVLAAAVYSWRLYDRNVISVQGRLQLTGLITQVPAQKGQIMQASSQGQDNSYILVPLAQNLREFAHIARNGRMAALALIKHAEAVRTELQCRRSKPALDELVRKLNEAKDSCVEALTKAGDDATLAATAKLGIGLCEEELGNFNEATRIYRELLDSKQYVGTAARAAAEHRLATMDDYKQKVVFAVAPVQATQPLLPPRQFGPLADANVPAGPNVPIELTVTPEPTVAGEPNVGATVPTVTVSAPNAVEAVAPNQPR